MAQEEKKHPSARLRVQGPEHFISGVVNKLVGHVPPKQRGDITIHTPEGDIRYTSREQIVQMYAKGGPISLSYDGEILKEPV